MYVITADQRGSRTSHDLVPEALAGIEHLGGDSLLLQPARTAGDEIQALIADASAALSIALMLTRSGSWSVGLGIGDVEVPLPDDVRAARGPAFFEARDAVNRAKKSSCRIAVSPTDAEAFIRLLVELRDRRSAEGWEVYDLLATGMTQRSVAHELGISEGAVSLRVSAAGIRLEQDTIPSLIRALEDTSPHP